MSNSSYVVTPPLMANGNIGTCRFVKVDTAADWKALQAGAGDAVVGISQEGPADPPGLNGSTAYAAVAGKTFTTYGPGAIVLLEAGSGGFTRGTWVKPDADGKGVTASAGDVAGALVLESAAEGAKGHVLVWPAIASLVNNIVAKTANFTLTAADSGKIFSIGTADIVATLPATSNGLRYTFVIAAAGLSASTGFSVSPVAADKIMGNGFTSADDQDAICTGATDREGDLSLGWYITRVIGTWARQA
jgi:hypothetical protein